MSPTFDRFFLGAPPWLIAAAMIGVVIHVSAGGVGILTGAAAAAARKGEGPHRRAGAVFFVAMLIMASVAAVLAGVLAARGVTGQWSNLLASAFTFYLVTTGWLTVRRPAGMVGRFEMGAAVCAVSVAAVALFVVLPLALGPGGEASGVPPVAPIICAAIALLAGAMDLKVALRRGVTGAGRIARHLWRMCFGWFIATGSFFLGQQKDMPEFMRGSPVLMALGLAPLALMLFWLGYVAFGRRFGRADLARA